jgi:GAF domain-containing protein
MLTEAVEMIRARFDLYYTQIYLTDPSRERLILRAGTGDVGSLLLQRGHNLVVNSGSLNGRAVLEKQAQIVVDTTENPAFLSNPLLPNTRSEMSIPLIVEGNVVGVLDMQSEHPGALAEGNLPAFEALAGQLAIAIRNAVLFMEVQEARSEVESQMVRFTEQGWGNFLNAIDQEHQIGFAFTDNKVTRLQPEVLSTASKANSLNLPIMVTGTKVGEIQFPANLKSNEIELISAVSEQLAQHVENLRLLAQAETFRKEAEQAVRRLTHEGWESYLSSSQLKTGYVYDLNQVQPLSGDNNPVAGQSLKQPLVVGDESIGELKLDLPESSGVASEILSAVAQQLSGHLENLRLSELNERHAQREQTLRQITSALRSSTNPATIMRTAVRELGSTLGRRAVIQMATPEQAAQGTENETDSPANPDGAVGGKV